MQLKIQLERFGTIFEMMFQTAATILAIIEKLQTLLYTRNTAKSEGLFNLRQITKKPNGLFTGAVGPRSSNSVYYVPSAFFGYLATQKKLRTWVIHSIRRRQVYDQAFYPFGYWAIAAALCSRTIGKKSSTPTNPKKILEVKLRKPAKTPYGLSAQKLRGDCYRHF
jgi:hypothetical protein